MPGLVVLPHVGGWLAGLMGLPGLHEAPLDPRIGTAASLLPGSLHNDPADGLVIATARVLGVKVVTRDAAILAYEGGC
jgi:PIN domain nuclease of toxin-antitoxin system